MLDNLYGNEEIQIPHLNLEKATEVRITDLTSQSQPNSRLRMARAGSDASFLKMKVADVVWGNGRGD